MKPLPCSPTADSTPLDQASFVVIDFETTIVESGAATYPEPIELAAMRVGPGLEIDHAFTFSSLIRPPSYAPVTPFVQKLTGITDAMLVDAPPLDTVFAEFQARLKAAPSILVAHYAPFDAGILWRFVQHCPAAATSCFVDSCALARAVVPGLKKYGLDSLCSHYAFEVPANRHRALADVELTVQVLLQLVAAAQASGKTTVGDLKDLAGLKTPRFRTSRFQTPLFAEDAAMDDFARKLQEEEPLPPQRSA